MYKTKAAAKAQLTRQENNKTLLKGKYIVAGTERFGFFIREKEQCEMDGFYSNEKKWQEILNTGDNTLLNTLKK